MGNTSAATSQSAYGVHPGVAMVRRWVSELKEKTGRSVDEWIALVKEGRAEGRKRKARMVEDKT